VFDASLLEAPRIGEALPRAVLDHLRGAEGQEARRALADEYRRAIADQLGATPAEAAVAMAGARATASLREMLARGVRLLLGSDTPANEGFGNPPGLNGRLELQRWAEAGAPPAAILRAATLDNAAAFGLAAEIGSVEVGKRADLLLLRASPLDGVAAYDEIELVFLRGEPIARGALAPAR
jgi:imidazolonepropionase-like amidohydrolase